MYRVYLCPKKLIKAQRKRLEKGMEFAQNLVFKRKTSIYNFIDNHSMKNVTEKYKKQRINHRFMPHLNGYILLLHDMKNKT